MNSVLCVKDEETAAMITMFSASIRIRLSCSQEVCDVWLLRSDFVEVGPL